jgi:hypothetical protein
MLITVGKFIYTNYWGILYVEHCGKIYLHKILRNILYVEHCGKVYLHKTLRNTVRGTLWEDLSTQNTEEYCMLNTEKIYLHTILRNTSCWTLWEDLFTQNTEEYCVLNTAGRLIYPKYWGILYVEHCGKMYFHKILRNTLCWTLWEDVFSQNSEEYFMLNTVGRFIYPKTEEYCMLNIVGRFIYTKYWGILYLEYCGKIYVHKILGTT